MTGPRPEQSTVLATPVFCPTDGVHLCVSEPAAS
jgi:hypothetical protein